MSDDIALIDHFGPDSDEDESSDLPVELSSIQDENIAAAVLKFMIATIPVENKLRKMSNTELARLILNEVWGYIPVNTIFSLVINEVINRLDPNLSKDEEDTYDQP